MCNKSKHYANAYASTISDKCKVSKSRKERCKYKITPKRVIEEETEVLSENLSTAFQAEIDPLVNKLECTNIKKTLQV